MTASPEELAAKYEFLGISLPPGTLTEACTVKKGTTTNRLALMLDQTAKVKRQRKLQTQREQAASEPFNAMDPDTSGDEVRARIGGLGIPDSALLDFRRHTKEKTLRPPPQGQDRLEIQGLRLPPSWPVQATPQRPKSEGK